MTFEDELRQVINKHSKENQSNTPDFILAEYLLRCLEAFNFASNQRQKWYGVDLKIGNKYNLVNAKECGQVLK